ncbi:MAG: DNA repair protein RecN [Actinomycetota bacterium]
MLLELHISGLGVIDDVTLEFAPGLNVLTGETGAGKTMVTVGLALTLGRRGQATLVRAGSERTGVEARFDVGGLEATREWAEDGQLVLGRTISTDGRSTARAGGQLCPASTLTELGESLIEIHGQNQTQRLLTPTAQLGFLDRFAGEEHVEMVGTYRAAFGRFRELRETLEELERDVRDRERDKDLLAYQVGEIEAAGLHPGEDRELDDEESLLANAERVIEQLGVARAALADDGGAADGLSTAAEALKDAANADRGAGELAARVGALAADVRDAAEALRAHADAVELDPARLEVVRERIAAVAALKRKYGETVEEVQEFLAGARRRLDALEHADDRRASLASDIEAAEVEARRLAERLSGTRSSVVPRLRTELEGELHELGMDGAEVELHLVSHEELMTDGRETLEVLFSGGAGQQPLPLGKVASGGELSRTMLACRTVLADLDDVPTIVFDEVDVGIGGRAAAAVGKRLARVAQRRQVLVVTHLPQIACFADRQFRVTKERGVARVQSVEEGERIEELSRMLSGRPTPEAATHAERLLAEAAKEKARS